MSRVYGGWRSWDDVVAGVDGALPASTLARLREAYQFAVACHGDQVRPAGEPYAEHLLEVLEILIAGAGVRDEPTLLAAALHDVVEDTGCTLDEVRARFGDEPAELVAWLTKGASRRDYLARLRDAPAAALDVKLADRLSNVQRLDTHPRPEKQRSYYRETVESIVPLAAGRPWFAAQFAAWQNAFRYLETEP
jgi:(p)ppGpp synthase/HD superfamily hydrolase